MTWSVRDAKRALDIGATAIMVSNHGGRQLDGSRSPFDQLQRDRIRSSFFSFCPPKKGPGRPSLSRTPPMLCRVPMSRNRLTKPSNSDRTHHEHGRSFRSKGYQAEDGSGVELLENVGKLNMMLRRKNACCLGRNRNRGQGSPTRGNRGRGTDSSNRVPSSRESANSRSPTKAHADRT